MRYLVDTDWVIDYMHGVPELVARFDELLPEGVGMSIVSLAELYEGVYGSRTQQSDESRLGNFLSFVDVILVDDAICRIFAGERSRLRGHRPEYCGLRPANRLHGHPPWPCTAYQQPPTLRANTGTTYRLGVRPWPTICPCSVTCPLKTAITKDVVPRAIERRCWTIPDPPSARRWRMPITSKT